MGGASGTGRAPIIVEFVNIFVVLESDVSSFAKQAKRQGEAR
jgi:hypothetical protein